MRRRDFLKHLLSGAAAVAGPLAFAPRIRAAETGGGYKALVCVLLEGGADTFNMVVPRQKELHDAYRSVRKGLSVPREGLLPVTDDYGLRDNMAGMQRLFGDGKLAIAANVGTLAEPVTKEAILRGAATLPPQLFAHNTQRDLWMRGDAKEAIATGWAARTGDAFYPEPNPYFNITVAGANAMQSGGRAEAMAFDDASISPNTMRYYGFGPETGGSDLGNVYQDIYETRQHDTNRLMAAFARREVERMHQQEILGGRLFDGVADFSGFTTGTHEVGKPLGRQLETVAKILSVHQNFPGERKRQIFFVNYHGWDTHNSDNAQKAHYLSESLAAFYDALEQLGMSEQVTLFTISDFGRSLSPNGAGTDHGWGTHAFVLGGAVKGGAFYGKLPELSPDSPDAWADRLIPTTAMESYLATLVRWFGATEEELDAIFPNLRSFALRDIGFMA